MDDGHDSALLRRHRPTDSFCHRPLSLSMPPNRSPGAFACPTACGIKFRLPLNTFFLPLKQHGIYPNDTSRRSLPSFSRVRPGTDRVFSPMQRRTGSPPPTSLCHRRCKAIYKNTKIPLYCNRLRNTFTNKIAPPRGAISCLSLQGRVFAWVYLWSPHR